MAWALSLLLLGPTGEVKTISVGEYPFLHICMRVGFETAYNISTNDSGNAVIGVACGGRFK